MIIRGILDKSLSKQTCIRGFARIKELARISKANPEYQRELIDKQKKVISNFLTEETYLFFPEVILSLKLKYDFTSTGAKKDAPLTLIEANKNFKSNVNSLNIKVVERKNSKVFDVGGRDEVKIVELEIEDGELLKLIKENKHPFHRIDGNHRLSAAEQIDDDRIQTMDVPFCIVLFEETTTNEFNPITELLEKKISNTYEKFERVVFYNINSKTIPLTLEQNLKGIIGETEYFGDDEIAKIFQYDGKDVGINARRLGLKIRSEDFQSIKTNLENYKWSLSLNIFRLYNKFKKGRRSKEIIDTVYEALQAVNTLYRDDELLKANKNIEILLAFLFYKAFEDKTTFNIFYHWIINNHLFEAEETKAESIIRIFNQIKEKEIKVFVAMPYFSTAIVKSHNEIYKSVIDEIKDKYGINITLHPIMTYKGESVNIVNDIFEKIKGCHIFIANITGNNANVTYEMGWARALDIPVIITKEEKAEEPKSDYKLDFYFTYQKDAHTTLKEEVSKHVKAILVERYKFKIPKE
ncbi:hypothetical protein EGI16_01305 [Chryseobacterium sp. G0240]|uniref:hypothetical protein n=1 Tax=Chryseobacterium sp. G0240 TaxID=2487066 RepID=UPI000F458DB4|nr:hypothetical protein [Chryseobacterium sp. G0240]ROI06573.1 hypothetical protein EGI16_01305 [Chryseobacterium sp. G0240]